MSDSSPTNDDKHKGSAAAELPLSNFSADDSIETAVPVVEMVELLAMQDDVNQQLDDLNIEIESAIAVFLRENKQEAVEQEQEQEQEAVEREQQAVEQKLVSENSTGENAVDSSDSGVSRRAA